jgi:hypothetical protein
MASEDIQHQIEARSRESKERVRDLLRKEGKLEALAEFDQSMKDLDTGLTGARSSWHSISPAQRRVIEYLANNPVKLIRSEKSTYYDSFGGDAPQTRVAGLKTVRALAERGFLDWEGGAFDPELKAALTERGRFVWLKGRDS